VRRTTSIFINKSTSLEELAKKISKCLTLDLTIDYDEANQIFRSFIEKYSVYIDIYDNHGLVDDYGIAFSSYEFHVSLDSDRSEKNEAKARTMRFLLVKKIIDEVGFDCNDSVIVVEGLNRVVNENELEKAGQTTFFDFDG